VLQARESLLLRECDQLAIDQQTGRGIMRNRVRDADDDHSLPLDPDQPLAAFTEKS
jgi:hypothetical protein